jgi:predicted ArsR family transcriptional regulator
MTQGVPYQPTEEQRRTVRAMSGYGMPQEDIATFLDIDPKTLRKHFQQELEKGSIEATTKVAQSLFRMATEGKNVAAAIFWMKARAGWREKHEIQLSQKAPEEMTDAELEAIIRGKLDETGWSKDPTEASRAYRRVIQGETG